MGRRPRAVRPRSRDLNGEQRRGLEILAGSPHGCTEEILRARGFTVRLLARIVHAGFAAAKPEIMKAFGRTLSMLAADDHRAARARRQSLRAFAAACCAAYALAAPLAEIRVPIDNFTFRPDVIKAPVGTRIVWRNDDDIPHSIVQTQDKFHSPALDTEDRSAFTFADAGTFDYFCGHTPI
jgi:plastocyanin